MKPAFQYALTDSTIASRSGPHGIDAATSSGVTYCVAAANPASSGGRNWFQLYMWKDRDRSMALVDRAAKAGYDTLLVTVRQEGPACHTGDRTCFDARELPAVLGEPSVEPTA